MGIHILNSHQISSKTRQLLDNFHLRIPLFLMLIMTGNDNNFLLSDFDCNSLNILHEIRFVQGNGYHLSLQATLDFSDQSTIRQLLDKIATRPKRKGFQPAGFGIEDMMTRMKNIIQGYDYCIKTAKFKWIDYSKMLPGEFLNI